MAAVKTLKVGDVLPPFQLIEDGQFYNRDNVKYCVRPECEGCQYDPVCKRQERRTKIGTGVNIREAFRARPGFVWASIDFRGIELRVAAQESGEPMWKNAFLTGRDLHTETARVMFKTDTPGKDDRDTAKCGNFNLLYLGSVETFHGFSPKLTFNEAAIAFKAWWAAVPIYKSWTEKIKIYIDQYKYTKTWSGRKGELKDMIARTMDKDGKVKQSTGKKSGMNHIYRKGINAIIQGGAADLLKIAMVRVTEFIEREKLEQSVKMLLTVHDELDFEILDNSEKFEILREIGRQMTLTPKGERLPQISNWKVPLEVDIEVGPNWGDMKDINDLDPNGEPQDTKVSPPPRKDVAVLQIASLRSEEDALRLHNAIFKASNVEGVVKIPLEVKMGDRIYGHDVLTRVASDFLRKEIEGIPGIKFFNT
jgi:hypothetical protein